MGDKFNYTNIEFNINDYCSNFPVIILKSEEEVSTYSIVHKFKSNGEFDYAVIGKVYAESLIEGVRDYKEFVSLITDVLSSEDKKNRHELLKKLKLCRFFRQMLFTQEGYDLITGKYLYTNGDVQKTVLAGSYVVDDEIFFDTTYFEAKPNKVTGIKNERGISTEIRLFDDYLIYEENYFVNTKDLQQMSVEDASMYVGDNYSRIIKYINLNFPSYSKNLVDINSFHTPEEKIAYMAQLLDVVHSVQFGEKNTKQF